MVEGHAVDSQVPASSALLRFTDAVLTTPDELPAARTRLVDVLGEAQMIDAAGVVGNFQRMVRIADSTGIPVDGPMAEMSKDLRAELGLNDLPSARLGV